jgi:predicted TIM-barrel fold metal-dependent hydrolase
MSDHGDDRYVVVSADCHAGAPLLGYREYLDARFRDDFDRWAAEFVNPFEDLDEVYADRNWDSAKRLAHLEGDGIAAEVIFPNTVPPFFPRNGIVAGAPSAADYEQRWAGLQAHNRWLVDFCADVPGRRAGIAQLLFNDPDDAVAEIARTKDAGLFGGVLLPSIPPGSSIPPIWSAEYDRIWDACVDLDVPVNHHGGSGSPDYGWELGMARMVYLTEFTFFSNRNVWHMIWGGVFERHPGLRYVITEQGFGNVLDGVRTQEYFFDMIHEDGSAARQLVGEAYVDDLPFRPSEYLRRNCWFGASMLSSSDAARRDEAGVARVMWGADYPHTEGTWPHSKDAMTAAVAGIPLDEARRMLGLNAAEFYGFDLDVLQPVADRVGPVVAGAAAS